MSTFLGQFYATFDDIFCNKKEVKIRQNTKRLLKKGLMRCNKIGYTNCDESPCKRAVTHRYILQKAQNKTWFLRRIRKQNQHLWKHRNRRIWHGGKICQSTLNKKKHLLQRLGHKRCLVVYAVFAKQRKK